MKITSLKLNNQRGNGYLSLKDAYKFTLVRCFKYNETGANLGKHISRIYMLPHIPMYIHFSKKNCKINHRKFLKLPKKNFLKITKGEDSFFSGIFF